MRRMAEESIDQQVADIIRLMEERKDRQFTSQNSGMKFKQIETLNGQLPFIASTSYGGEGHIITNTFSPESQRPAICVPQLEFDETGYRFDKTIDYARDYMNVLIYDQSNTMLGYMDVWTFYHRSDLDSTDYAWQTIVYTWANTAFNIPFTISLRATDSGSHKLTIESYTL